MDLIDVRSPAEYNGGHAEGAANLPLPQVTPEAVQALRKGRDGEPVYIICQSGGRSQAACNLLANAGMTHIINVVGGTSAWKAAGLPVTQGPASWQQYIRPAGIVLMLAGIILGFTVSWYFLILTAATWLGMVLSGNCPLLCVLRARMLRPSNTNCTGTCSIK